MVRGKDRGKIKLDVVSLPHDKCREDYVATQVTRQKKERGKTKQIAQNDAEAKRTEKANQRYK